MARGDPIPWDQALPCTFISLLAFRSPLQPTTHRHSITLPPWCPLPPCPSPASISQASHLLLPGASHFLPCTWIAVCWRAALCWGERPPAGGAADAPLPPTIPRTWPHSICSAFPLEQHGERGCAGSRNEPGLGKHHLPPTQPPTAPRLLRRLRRAGAHGAGAAGAEWGLRPARRPTHGQDRGRGRGVRAQQPPVQKHPWNRVLLQERGWDVGLGLPRNQPSPGHRNFSVRGIGTRQRRDWGSLWLIHF